MLHRLSGCTPLAVEPNNIIIILNDSKITTRNSRKSHHVTSLTCHSFIHSGHFYSAPSSPLLLRGGPDYSTDTVSEFHAEAHMQLQVKDLPKVPTWRLERESNPRPSG